MPEYEKIELSDLISNPNLWGKTVEVKAVPKGIQTGGFLRQGYTAFLKNEDGLLLIKGSYDSYILALREVSMLRMSSETGQPISIQGKVKGSYPTHYLHVDGVKLGNYTSILYQKNSNE